LIEKFSMLITLNKSMMSF